MSNVVQLRPTANNNAGPGVIYVVRSLAKGPAAAMESLRRSLWAQRQRHRNGEYAAEDGSLLALCGWTTCRETAEILLHSLEENDLGEDVDHRLMMQWPYDVSNWPSAQMADTPSTAHFPPDVVKGLRP